MCNNYFSESESLRKRWDRRSYRQMSSVLLQNRSKKLIQESAQHLKNVGETLQNDKWLPSTGLPARGEGEADGGVCP